MKNNKGFTLVELLAVIVILAILITIASTSTIGISNKIKKDMYCKKIDAIETAAKLYGESRKDSFSTEPGYTYGNSDSTETLQNLPSETIRVKDLIESGDLKKDNNSEPFIVDPRNNEGMDDLSLIVYVKYNRIYVAFPEDVKTTCSK